MQPDLDDIGGAKELAMPQALRSLRMIWKRQYRILKESTIAPRIIGPIMQFFRAISACLALEFKAYKQHSQVIGNFNKDFVHTGIFPKEISRKISRAAGSKTRQRL